MIFKELELKNFLRHKHFRHVFDGRTLMLSGENGCGKTSIMTALRFAVRGTIDSVDKKAPNSRAIRRPAKSASVKLVFEVDGKTGTIVRGLTASGGSSRTLEWDGRTFTKDAEVDEVMTQIMGSSLKAVENLVFVPQGALEMLFSGTPGERHALWAKLTAINSTDKIVSNLDAAIKRLSAGISDYTMALQSAEDMVVEREAALAQAHVDLLTRSTYTDAETQMSLAEGKGLDLLRQLKSAWESHDEAVAQMQRTNALLGLAHDIPSENEIAALRSVIDDLTAKLQTNAQMRAAVAVYKQKHQELTSELEKSVTKSGLEMELAASGALELGLKVPVSPVTSVGLSDLMQVRKTQEMLTQSQNDWVLSQLPIPGLEQKAVEAKSALDASILLENDIKIRIGKLQADTQSAEKLLNAIGHVDTCDCPVCGQGVEGGAADYLNRQVTEHRARVLEAARELTALQATTQGLAAAYQAAGMELAAAEQTRSRLQHQVETYQAFLAGKPGPDEADRLAEAIVTWQSDKAIYDAALASLKREQDDLKRRIAQLGAVRNALVIKTDIDGLVEPQDTGLDAEYYTLAEATRLQQEKLASALSKVSAVASTKQQHEQAKQALAASTSTINTLLEHEQVKGIPGLLSFGITSLDAIENTIEKLAAAFEAYAAAQNNVTAAEQSLRTITSSRDAILEKMKAQAGRQSLISDLKRVSATFAPSGAPGDYLAHEFSRLAIDVQDYLAETGASFTVTASETDPLAFDFLKLGEPGAEWLPFSQLSGGQRVTLALGTLHACHKLFIPHVGIMCLDEPSLHLSSSAKENLAEWIRGMETSGEMQLVICDHAPEVVNAAGQLVEFE